MSSRPHPDGGILDSAALLFAQRGYPHTSVQAIADSLGLSKGGLQHHYPSKDALRDAVLADCRSRARRVLDQVSWMPAGRTRDRQALELIVELALTRPGLVSLMLSADRSLDEHLDDVTVLLYRAFDTDLNSGDNHRLIRVTGALAAVGVLALAMQVQPDPSQWRSEIVATALDTLGATHVPPTGHLGPDTDPEV